MSDPVTLDVVPYARLNINADDCIMAMWALEMLCDYLSRDGAPADELAEHDEAYELHQRIQSAWKVLLEKSGA